MTKTKSCTTKPRKSARKPRRTAPELAEHDRVAELEKQLEEANSKALYAAAETQNVRRRLEAEKAAGGELMRRPRSRATCWRSRTISTGRWPRCSDELRADKTAANFLAGIEATARELESVFARNGITRIKSVGEALDPHRHQAMMEIPTDDAEPGTIVEEMQPGYMLKDRLLRPALVGVAKKPD